MRVERVCRSLVIGLGLGFLVGFGGSFLWLGSRLCLCLLFLVGCLLL